jgi:hypothetical protein
MERKEFKEIMMVRIKDLIRDAAYQRKLNKRRARAIADKFNPEIFDPITVVRRGTKWAVIDGATRSYAAELAGYEEIPATQSAARTEQAEATLYSDKNRSQKPLSAIELYRSDVLAGRPDAVAIQGMLDDVGWTVEKEARGIAALRNAYARYGAGPTGRALRVLAKVFEGQRRVPSRLIIGTIAFIRYHRDGVNDRHLVVTLTKHLVGIGRAMDARGEQGSSSRPQVGSDAICDHYNRGLRTRQLHSTECTVCLVRDMVNEETSAGS